MPGPPEAGTFARSRRPMSVIFLLLTVSTVVATVFLLGFIWAVRRGQYDDDHSPAVRILMDDAPQPASSAAETGTPNSSQVHKAPAQTHSS